MEFDIQYLLLLQDLRNATGGMFDEIFNSISKFAVDILPFLPYIVFWCVDKKWGYRFMATIWAGEVLNGWIKLTVCAYRPWIRSDLIQPAGDSKVAATGYSFPSGHTMASSALYGTTFVWQKDKRKGIAVLCAVMIFLTGFSRNFLGVHTPQDVLVGFTESMIIIAVIGAVQKKLEGDEKKQDIATFAGIVLVICGLVYIMAKPYPMDYVEGVLLVDPQKMMNDSFKAAGGCLGFLIGSYVERHYIHYEIPFNSKSLAFMTCSGAFLMFTWKELFADVTFVAAFGGHWGHLIARFLMTIFAMIVWPIAILKTAKSANE